MKRCERGAHPSPRRGWAAAAAVAVLLASAPALAQSRDQQAAAQVLFEEALTLMKDGKAGAACPKLEKSQELDPGMGTQFRLAECYEATGRLATAWSLYVDVAESAKLASSREREDAARRRADALQPKLPKLTITPSQAAKATAGLELTRDGAPVGATLWGTGIPVDLGEHEVTATAPGKRTWRSRVHITEAGSSTEVTVPALEGEAAAALPPAHSAPAAGTGPTAPDGGGLSGQRAAALVVGAIGVAGLAVGTVFGLQASSTWDEAQTGCPGISLTDCTTEAVGLGESAETQALVSTIGFAAGGVAIAAAGVLWFTAPSRTAPQASRAPGERRVGLRLTPVVGPTGAGGVVQGRFW